MDINDKIDKTIIFIDYFRNELENGDIENRQILNLIENLVNKYKEYPSHKLYRF
jgi:hypothetical protein